MIDVLNRRHPRTSGPCRALEAFLISGDYDYLIRIAVKNTKDYERMLREKLYKIPGIRHSKSSFVLHTLKRVDTPLDI